MRRARAVAAKIFGKIFPEIFFHVRIGTNAPVVLKCEALSLRVRLILAKNEKLRRTKTLATSRRKPVAEVKSVMRGGLNFGKRMGEVQPWDRGHSRLLFAF